MDCTSERTPAELVSLRIHGIEIRATGLGGCANADEAIGEARGPIDGLLAMSTYPNRRMGRLHRLCSQRIALDLKELSLVGDTVLGP